MIGVAVLGSTGSIGESTLDVLRRHPDRFRAVALTANRNAERLFAQCVEFRPDFALIGDVSLHAALAARLRGAGLATTLLAGPAELPAIATLPAADFVMAAIVGAAGLRSTLAAAGAGKRLLIANKEALVMAGRQVLSAATRSGATIIPIDSEHNAVFQCLPGGTRLGAAPEGVRRIMLTASGGPFRSWSASALQTATPEQACAHPTWNMGRKISVDSATLMNKGLELIEAQLLFGLPVERIEVVIHPQSVVHSLVEYVDGSVLAQLGSPDMRTPIAQALAWPQRLASGVQFLDLLRVARLDFEPPDLQRFPCLGLAIAAARAGAEMPAVLSAANEVAVEAFLEGRLNFAGIEQVIGDVMDGWLSTSGTPDLDAVLAADARARQLAAARVAAGPRGARSVSA
ncbi:MAG TPA: 1-deoxy-D-xylulose-5-phosphate reductoisomerase [Steroidobacteraceae bacterium]|nr:1-deoxy-D-xylulose-5-phosphate reductoisomerase [Steroidobacteraceae bacterium]